MKSSDSFSSPHVLKKFMHLQETNRSRELFPAEGCRSATSVTTVALPSLLFLPLLLLYTPTAQENEDNGLEV